MNDRLHREAAERGRGRVVVNGRKLYWYAHLPGDDPAFDGTVYEDLNEPLGLAIEALRTVTVQQLLDDDGIAVGIEPTYLTEAEYAALGEVRDRPL